MPWVQQDKVYPSGMCQGTLIKGYKGDFCKGVCFLIRGRNLLVIEMASVRLDNDGIQGRGDYHVNLSYDLSHLKQLLSTQGIKLIPGFEGLMG